MRILVTGGAGYIGSHVCVELLTAGHEVVVVDNFSNSSAESLQRIKLITGKQVALVRGDINNFDSMAWAMSQYDIEAVMHFAGLKSVGESSQWPLKYYANNVEGTIVLLEAMEYSDVRNLIFSSSATVYGVPRSVPINELAPTSVTNPYGRTKLMIEHILDDLLRSNESWKIAKLRYFNPVGAHESGLIGESPRGAPSNLMPCIAQVAARTLEYVSVYGDDYPTPDGTGIRDYIHVVDLARGHLAALNYLNKHGQSTTVNLGTGRGYSVLEVISAFEKASQKKIPYKLMGRRPGDVASCYADPLLAKLLLGWEAERTLDDMCQDHWNWQRQNPKGY